ncbi:Molybdopterin-guanine dinucleotide biosynthesis protein MobA [Caballeronia sordidicola]|uniref:Molybdopterin-guanine dinucleotide biosynthesis protein MobA n=1 Tax=Caballeronia sordidicola TaxID=196367 RepID=A0A242MPQ8_CABSO|nr:Molybdopterin-guanine dinucleotide biosynthesis protein MobA [Caballeronia sordidicola]
MTQPSPPPSPGYGKRAPTATRSCAAAIPCRPPTRTPGASKCRT